MANQWPYEAQERNGYWVVIDKRTGALASYPSNKRDAKANAAFMVKAYQEAMAEAVA